MARQPNEPSRRAFLLAGAATVIVARAPDTGTLNPAVVAYDLATRKVTGRLELPVKPGVTAADWDFDAPHRPRSSVRSAAGRPRRHPGSKRPTPRRTPSSCRGGSSSTAAGRDPCIMPSRCSSGPRRGIRRMPGLKPRWRWPWRCSPRTSRTARRRSWPAQWPRRSAPGRPEEAHALLAYGYAHAGRAKEARAVLDTMRARSGGRVPAMGATAVALEELGDHEAAVTLFGAAIARHDPWLVQFPQITRYDRLRKDPRVAAMLAKLLTR